MNLFEAGSLRELARRVTQNPVIGRTVVESPPLGVDQSDHIGGILGDDAKQFIAFPGTSLAEINPRYCATMIKSKARYEMEVRGIAMGRVLPPVIGRTGRGLE
jgi:hypothetical protein